MHSAEIIASLLLIVELSAVVLIVAQSLINGISPMPSLGRARSVMITALDEYGVNGTIIDLGSGWGGLCRAMGRRRPDCAVIGYESSLVPYLFSVVMRWIGRRRNVRFACRNFHRINLHDADCVVCYLFPGAMRALAPKLEAELKGGAIIVSNTFALPGWKAQRTIGAGDWYGTNVYVYRKR